MINETTKYLLCAVLGVLEQAMRCNPILEVWRNASFFFPPENRGGRRGGGGPGVGGRACPGSIREASSVVVSLFIRLIAATTGPR